MVKYSETINDILNFFDDVEITYKEAIAKRNETEAEIQDILHELEYALSDMCLGFYGRQRKRNENKAEERT